MPNIRQFKSNPVGCGSRGFTPGSQCVLQEKGRTISNPSREIQTVVCPLWSMPTAAFLQCPHGMATVGKYLAELAVAPNGRFSEGSPVTCRAGAAAHPSQPPTNPRQAGSQPSAGGVGEFSADGKIACRQQQQPGVRAAAV